MPLLLDRTAELSGRSMAHALVIGISKYQHLPCEDAPGPFRELTQTSFCARSAMTFAKWLLENRDQIAVPLATCRVLLAPSDRELESDPTLRENVEECSVANFIA